MLNIGMDLLTRVADIARRAGARILTVYETDFDVETKGDASPVTQADRLAEALITEAIRGEITADHPIVGEEAAEAEGLIQPEAPVFWLVDPLDGTKEFVKRNGEFTVNIALVENGEPVLGVVHLPVLDETFLAAAGLGAFKRTGDGPLVPISARVAPAAGVTAVVSRSHGAEEADAFLARYRVAERIGAGSSLKFCRVAEGAADIYPRFGRTMEWDTAAGHAVVRFAGGQVVTTDGRPLTYGKPGLENPHFIVTGKGIGRDG
ncbi:MAG: 3'(2'),5'-bisphosphate nucleotidase [Rhodospirillales bacterium CG15_BIG_FIL_POST_REV_8_21_14_020_66_15]|nr:MAG: 3'(2'),5'-bisphosphate nucleotidase [Rhodospirillales bacterium CG15_BIG_FIL_POST_REV_8_21_14_020_66_15]